VIATTQVLLYAIPNLGRQLLAHIVPEESQDLPARESGDDSVEVRHP